MMLIIKLNPLEDIVNCIKKHFVGFGVNFSFMSDPEDGSDIFLINIEIPESVSVNEAMDLEDKFDRDMWDRGIRTPSDWVVRLEYR